MKTVMTDVISEEAIIRCDVCQTERDMEDLTTQVVFVDLIGQPRGTVGIKYCTDNTECQENSTMAAGKIYRELTREN